MVSLYNCKHDGDQYRITKFTDGLEIESSYLVDPTACECPAFDKRGRCKHQEMLPFFINRKAVGSGEMYDWDRGGWVRMFDDAEIGVHGPVVTTADFDSANGGSSPPAPAKPQTKLRRR